MNILVTLNSGYIKPLQVMLYSLCVNNPGKHVDVYVIHSSLTAEDFDKIHFAVEGFDCKIISLPVSDDKYADVPFSDRLPKETYYRIFAADVLPAELDRILYLDPDLVVNKSLDALYNIDFKGNMFAGATHVFDFTTKYNRRRLDMSEGSIYINAGVMMMNLEQIHKTPILEKDIFGYIAKYNKKLYLFDQDVLNGLYSGQTLAIDEKLYNLCDGYITLYNLNPMRKGKIRPDWIEQNTVIFHYCGKNKPWKADYKGILAKYFDKYAGRFYDLPIPGRK